MKTDWNVEIIYNCWRGEIFVKRCLRTRKEKHLIKPTISLNKRELSRMKSFFKYIKPSTVFCCLFGINLPKHWTDFDKRCISPYPRLLSIDKYFVMVLLRINPFFEYHRCVCLFFNRPFMFFFFLVFFVHSTKLRLRK